MKFSKKGDHGETSLLGGQRVPKFDPRPDTYGTLDEASSALGVARAMTHNKKIKDILLSVQKDLLTLGAELSTLPKDLIDELQKEVTLKNEFIYPGETVISAQIDVARTIIRRAERKAAKLKMEKLIENDRVHQYLNRLADMLFTLARYEEQKE